MVSLSEELLSVSYRWAFSLDYWIHSLHGLILYLVICQILSYLEPVRLILLSSIVRISIQLIPGAVLVVLVSILNLIPSLNNLQV